MARPRPNFFVVGAPKCGTTAMDDYLKQHPEIFVPDRKELHYFGSDLRFLKAPRISERDYLAHFESAGDRKVIGEASVWYLYSERAAAEIREFCPRAKIIIILRNPVDMMYSLHSQFLYECNEDLVDFAAALNAEHFRQGGAKVPNGIYFLEGLYYRAVARFSDQVRRYLKIFGRDNLHIISFDDFKHDTLEVYQDTLRFLDVAADFKPKIQILNSNKEVRNRSLQFFLNNPPHAVLQLSRRLCPTRLRHAIIERIKRLNSKQMPRPPLHPVLRLRLAHQFSSEIERLSHVVGRDFTHWSSPLKKSPPIERTIENRDYLVDSGMIGGVVG